MIAGNSEAGVHEVTCITRNEYQCCIYNPISFDGYRKERLECRE